MVHWCTAVSASLSASGRIAKLVSTPAGGDGVKHVTDVITFDDKRPGDGHESPEKSACRRERPRIVVIRNAITVTDPRALSLRLRKNSPARVNALNVSTGCVAQRPSPGCSSAVVVTAVLRNVPRPDVTKIRCVCAHGVMQADMIGPWRQNRAWFRWASASSCGSDRIFALEPLIGDERGDGHRTRVWIEGVKDPIIAARTGRDDPARHGSGGGRDRGAAHR